MTKGQPPTQIAVKSSARSLLTKYAGSGASLVIIDPPDSLSEDPNAQTTMDDQAAIMQALMTKTVEVLKPGGSVVLLGSQNMATPFTLACTWVGFHSMAEITVLWHTTARKGGLIQAASKASTIRWFVKPGLRGQTYSTMNLPSNVLVATPVPFGDRVNPAQRPVELFNYIISVMSDKYGPVIDPFCGSGSSLVAAAFNDRWAIGGDHSQEQVDHANRRVMTIEDEEAKLQPLYWWLGKSKYKPVEAR